MRAEPVAIRFRADNDPEMFSKTVKAWCDESATSPLYIDPGSPWQNRIVERFNVRLRDELLTSEIVATLAEARLLLDRWRLHYNHRRIQRALGKMSPAAFAATHPALPPLRLAVAPPGMEGMATMHPLSNGVDQ